MLNIAQIGVGYWGPNLLRNLVLNENCHVSHVVDLSDERRNFVKKTYPNINVHNEIDKLLADDELDAIVIATPVNTHFDIGRKCLENNKHILVEKPMALKAEEVKKMGKIANKNQLIAMAGHTFLYNSAVQYIKKLIDDGELGEIRYIYSQRVNLGRIRNDVDALWNLAPHDVSIIQYWLNNIEPIQVKRFGQSFVQKDIDDVVFLNILYPNRIIANIHVSWLDPHKIRRMTIVGSKKMVVYDDIAKDKIVIYDKGIDRVSILGEKMDFDKSTSILFNHRSGDVIIPKLDWQEPLRNEIEHFIDCIKNGTQCLTDSIHAEKVVEILEKSS